MGKQKIIITGISGLLGSALEAVLRDGNNDVCAILVDIGDNKAMEALALQQGVADWVIHTAAVTDVDLCERDQRHCYNVNVEGTRNVRNLAKNLGARLIYISTVSVFSGVEGNYKETDIPYPKNFYNLSKLLGEQCALEYEKTLAIRLNLIGIHPQGSRGKNFFEWLINEVAANKDIQLFSDVMINPLSNWTIAALIGHILKTAPQEKILHIASRNILSKADMGKLVIERMGYRGKATYCNVGDGQGLAPRPKQIWLNSDYAQTKLGLAMPSLESEIEKILKISKLIK